MRIALPLLALVLVSTAFGSTIQFQSGPEQVTLLELYTSEGCSSCPPADRWISQLKDSPRLWTEVVPVAFHVAYWDYLGWPDPWGRQAYSQRQRLMANQAGAGVYTPGFFLNGKEWRGFFNRQALPRASNERPGTLVATVQGDGTISIEFDSATTKIENRRTYHIALLGNEITSKVTRGENAGRTLVHDFTVLKYLSIPAKEGAGTDVPVGTFFKSAQDVRGQALAVWVTEGNSLTPLQATGGWLKGL